jgi:alkylation response protein AidB-like acyl-CoA dehydrogenase
MNLTNIEDVQKRIAATASEWATERKERQHRRELVRADFDALAEAGFTLTGVPESMGGLWRSIEESTRPVCELLRTLAHGDSSVALVSAMHPGVLNVFGWLSVPEADPKYQQEWDEQRNWAFQTALDGHFWGTISSEPGSGGDISRTRSTATLSDGKFLMNGTKHFGSGSGMTSFMVTTAVVEGEDRVEDFFIDMRGVPLDGSKGIKVIAPWDGHGMTATQSHGLTFTDVPVTRRAWEYAAEQIRPVASAAVSCMFTAVIVGIIGVAVATARAQISKKRDGFSAYERTEWSQVEVEAWQITQLYDGMLRSLPDRDTRGMQALLGKTAIAQLSESLMTRLSKVVGGSAFSRHAPYGSWAQDVRALGFLRPPWGLAFDQIHQSSWDE